MHVALLLSELPLLCATAHPRLFQEVEVPQPGRTACQKSPRKAWTKLLFRSKRFREVSAPNGTQTAVHNAPGELNASLISHHLAWSSVTSLHPADEGSNAAIGSVHRGAEIPGQAPS